VSAGGREIGCELGISGVLGMMAVRRVMPGDRDGADLCICSLHSGSEESQNSLSGDGLCDDCIICRWDEPKFWSWAASGICAVAGIDKTRAAPEMAIVF